MQFRGRVCKDLGVKTSYKDGGKMAVNMNFVHLDLFALDS